LAKAKSPDSGSSSKKQKKSKKRKRKENTMASNTDAAAAMAMATAAAEDNILLKPIPRLSIQRLRSGSISFIAPVLSSLQIPSSLALCAQPTSPIAEPQCIAARDAPDNAVIINKSDDVDEQHAELLTPPKRLDSSPSRSSVQLPQPLLPADEVPKCFISASTSSAGPLMNLADWDSLDDMLSDLADVCVEQQGEEEEEEEDCRNQSAPDVVVVDDHHHHQLAHPTKVVTSSSSSSSSSLSLSPSQPHYLQQPM
jgi:hypothetical protein